MRTTRSSGLRRGEKLLPSRPSIRLKMQPTGLDSGELT